MTGSYTYLPSKDEMLLNLDLGPVRGRPNKVVDRFKLWCDDEGNFKALAIVGYRKELEEFRRNLAVIRLGGIWRGVKISERDIREARATLLGQIEEKW